MFNIIARKTLLAYCLAYPKAANALKEWYSELLKAEYGSFQALKTDYGNASLVGDDRVIFNIRGTSIGLWCGCLSNIKPCR